MSAENSGKHLAGRDSAQNPAGELTALPSPMIGGEGLAAPLQDPTPLSAFGLDFRSFWASFSSLPNSLHFPNA